MITTDSARRATGEGSAGSDRSVDNGIGAERHGGNCDNIAGDYGAGAAREGRRRANISDQYLGSCGGGDGRA